MFSLAQCFTAASVVSGFVSAFLWWKSSRIKYESKLLTDVQVQFLRQAGKGVVHVNPGNGIPPGVYIDGFPVATIEKIHDYLGVSSSLNSWAAAMSAVAVILTVLTTWHK